MKCKELVKTNRDKGRRSTLRDPCNYRERGIFLHPPKTMLLAPERTQAVAGSG